MAMRIDGRQAADEVLEKVRAGAEHLAAKKGVTPGLAVVIVGEDPASQFYVRSKGKRAAECGFKSVTHRLDASTSEADLLALIDELNADDQCFDNHGVKIIVDPRSLEMLDGTQLDFVREGLNEGFKFNNPNAKNNCGCGESFAV